MDEWITTLRAARPVPGEEKVLIPQREYEESIMKNGIELVPKVIEDLKVVAAELKIDFE
ncbi:MAG: hypothetical protein R2744_06760 [Bacteroidales bacterium]